MKALEHEKACLPQRRSLGIGIKGVHGVTLGRHVDYVMGSLPGDRHIRHVERLCVDSTINPICEPQSEVARAHIRWSQDGFVQVLAGVGLIVVRGENAQGRRLSKRRQRHGEA
jgi:hypothetical protein